MFLDQLHKSINEYIFIITAAKNDKLPKSLHIQPDEKYKNIAEKQKNTTDT